jgi:multiple sugar transport system permease protein
LFSGVSRWRRSLPLARPLAAALISAAIALPLASLVAGALRSPGEVLPPWPDLFFVEPTLAAFSRAFELVDLEVQLVNSLLVVFVAVPVSVLVASWAGFAMTMLPRRQRRLAVGLALLLLMVPASALWVPRFVIFSRIGLTDTLAPLVAPALLGTTPFAVLLFYFSFRRIPGELIDAARLEGLGPWAVWRQVAAPLVRPTTSAVAILVFVAHWGNFVDALLYLSSPDVYTLPLGLGTLGTLAPTVTSVLLAGAVVATVPAIVAFALAQRRVLLAARAGAQWPGR